MKKRNLLITALVVSSIGISSVSQVSLKLKENPLEQTETQTNRILLSSPDENVPSSEFVNKLNSKFNNVLEKNEKPTIGQVLMDSYIAMFNEHNNKIDDKTKSLCKSQICELSMNDSEKIAYEFLVYNGIIPLNFEYTDMNKIADDSLTTSIYNRITNDTKRLKVDEESSKYTKINLGVSRTNNIPKIVDKNIECNGVQVTERAKWSYDRIDKTNPSQWTPVEQKDSVVLGGWIGNIWNGIKSTGKAVVDAGKSVVNDVKSAIADPTSEESKSTMKKVASAYIGGIVFDPISSLMGTVIGTSVENKNKAKETSGKDPKKNNTDKIKLNDGKQTVSNDISSTENNYKITRLFLTNEGATSWSYKGEVIADGMKCPEGMTSCKKTDDGNFLCTFEFKGANTVAAIAQLNTDTSFIDTNGSLEYTYIPALTTVEENGQKTTYIPASNLRVFNGELEIIDGKYLRNVYTNAQAVILKNAKIAIVGNEIVHLKGDSTITIGNELYYNMDIIAKLLSNGYVGFVAGKDSLYYTDDLKYQGLYEMKRKDSDTVIQKDFVQDIQKAQEYAKGKPTEFTYDENLQILNLTQASKALNTTIAPIQLPNNEIGYIIVDWKMNVPESLTKSITKSMTISDINKIYYTAPKTSNTKLTKFWSDNLYMTNALANYMFQTRGQNYFTCGYYTPSVTILSKDPLKDDQLYNEVATLTGVSVDAVKAYFNPKPGNDNSLEQARKLVGYGNTKTLGKLKQYGPNYFLSQAGVIYQAVRTPVIKGDYDPSADENKAVKEITDKQKAVDEAKKKLEKAEKTLTAYKDYDTILEKYKKADEDAKAELQKAKDSKDSKAIAEANKKVKKAQSDLAGQINIGKPDQSKIDEATKAVEDCKSALEKAKSELDSTSDKNKDAKDKEEKAQKEIELKVTMDGVDSIDPDKGTITLDKQTEGKKVMQDKVDLEAGNRVSFMNRDYIFNFNIKLDDKEYFALTPCTPLNGWADGSDSSFKFNIADKAGDKSQYDSITDYVKKVYLNGNDSVINEGGVKLLSDLPTTVPVVDVKQGYIWSNSYLFKDYKNSDKKTQEKQDITKVTKPTMMSAYPVIYVSEDLYKAAKSTLDPDGDISIVSSKEEGNSSTLLPNVFTRGLTQGVIDSIVRHNYGYTSEAGIPSGAKVLIGDNLFTSQGGSLVSEVDKEFAKNLTQQDILENIQASIAGQFTSIPIDTGTDDTVGLSSFVLKEGTGIADMVAGRDYSGFKGNILFFNDGNLLVYNKDNDYVNSPMVNNSLPPHVQTFSSQKLDGVIYKVKFSDDIKFTKIAPGLYTLVYSTDSIGPGIMDNSQLFVDSLAGPNFNRFTYFGKTLFQKLGNADGLRDLYKKAYRDYMALTLAEWLEVIIISASAFYLFLMFLAFCFELTGTFTDSFANWADYTQEHWGRRVDVMSLMSAGAFPSDGDPQYGKFVLAALILTAVVMFGTAIFGIGGELFLPM